MAKNAAARAGAGLRLVPPKSQVIDIRTRRAWRPPDAPVWPFFVDMAITLALVLAGTWLFIKMRGG